MIVCGINKRKCMKAIKKATYPLDKCYALSHIRKNNTSYIAIAAEKEDACLLFTAKGQFIEKIWNGPSGTMSIVPLQNENGAFLATKKMFSPDNGNDAYIALLTPSSDGWQEKKIADIPYAHRFDVLRCASKRYLVCATIKKSCEYKGDWRFPGQYTACELPEDLSGSVDLKPQVVIDGLLKNHGYIHRCDTNGDYSIIGTDSGIYEIHPPCGTQSDWTVTKLLEEPTSDMAFTDFDGDEQEEMITLSPFHGDTVKIFKKQKGVWNCVYEHPDKLEFVHSIWAGKIKGKSIAIIGHRKGESRDLYCFFYDNGYRTQLLDKDCGSTNVLVYSVGNADYLVSANREINEIAFYELQV